MSRIFRRSLLCATVFVGFCAGGFAGPQERQTTNLNICHAGSVSGAFAQVENEFKRQNPGVTIRDVSGGSLDLARQLANGLQDCDVFATADYTNIALLLMPAHFADYNILFARGRMVLAYLATNPAANAIAGSGEFRPPDTIPDAVPNWHQIVLAPGVKIGGVHPFLDPGSYRSHLIFQLAQSYYKVPNLYNDFLKHFVAFAQTTANKSSNELNQIALNSDFQFSYEHSARATARKMPEYRYVHLPENVDLSDPAKNGYYGQSAIVVPGLGLPEAAASVSIPGTRVAWGVTVLNKSPNKENAIRFLQLLLGETGKSALTANGPTPITPPCTSIGDHKSLPAALKPLVKAMELTP